jgi:predicted dehydrogenase
VRQIGVGVIGVGLMGSLFARLASQLPDSELVGVADANKHQAAQVGESLGVPAYTDYNELLALSGMSAVVIATPDALHLEPALAAAGAGKHVLIEKPLATNEEDGRRIVEACRRAGVTLMVAHVLRFDPNYGEAFKAVHSGRLGEIVHLSARRNTSLPDAKRLAGRVTITFYLGSHSIDAMQWIVGSPIVEVTAIGTRKAMQELGVDDTVMSLLRFENGAIGTLENSWIRPEGAGSRRIGASLIVMGTEGSLRVEPFQECMTTYRPNYVEPALPLVSFDNTVWGKISGIYRDEFGHFIDCIQTAARPIISPEQALSAIIVCGAIERSLREGVPVHVNQENVFVKDR